MKAGVIGFIFFVFSVVGNSTDHKELSIEYDIDFFSDIEQNAEAILSISTRQSPKKRPISVILDSPGKLHVKRVKYGEKNCRIIFSGDTEFHDGTWAYIEPLSANPTVVVDANHRNWAPLTSNFFAFHNEIKSEHDFIFQSIKYIHKNIRMIKKTGDFKDRENTELVCRHYATLSLPLFARVFKKNKLPFSGKVHQVAAELIDQDWKQAADGHVWNLLEIEANGHKTYWFVDVFNKMFVNMSESKNIDELSLQRIGHRGQVRVVPLTSDQQFYDYVRATKRKFAIDLDEGISWDQEPGNCLLGMKKFAANYRVPSAARRVIHF